MEERKLKYFLSLTTILLMISGSVLSTQTCKKRIPYSFGMTGIEKANDKKAVCPGSTKNCCSEIDQMKIHKLYHKHVKPLVHGDHNKNKAALLGLSATTKELVEIDFHDYIKKYEKKFPSMIEYAKKKLKHYSTTLAKYKKEGLIKSEGELKEASKEYYKRILHLRKGFLCGICDHNTHLFIDVDSNEIIYSAAFCTNLVSQNIQFFKLKYVDYLNYFFTLVDLLFMMMGEELMTKEDMTFYRAVVTDVEKCSTGGDAGNCNGLCAQFNINKMSLLWDGEKMPLDHFKEKMGVLLPKLKDKENIEKLFKYDEKYWEAEKAKEEEKKKAEEEAKKKAKETKKSSKKEEEKLPTPSPLQGSALEKVKEDSLHFTFKTRSIIEHTKIHGVPDIEHIDGIDNEEDEFRLFKLSPKPIKIEKFAIKIASLGLDPLQASKDNNLETSPEQIIELIFAKGSEILPRSEKLADSTIELLKKISIAEIGDFVNHAGISFDRFVSKKPPMVMVRPKASLLGTLFP